MPTESLLSLFVLALTTGLLGHVALDGLANLALAHDPYDDLAHGSRTTASLVVVAFATFASIRALGSVVVDAANGRYRTHVHALLRVPLPLLVVAVALLGSTILAALETSDLFCAGQQMPDLTKLSGGSIPLAAGTLVGCATGLCLAARALVRMLANVRPTLVRAIAMVFAALARSSTCVVTPVAIFAHDRLHSRTIVSRRARKRAPPILLTR